MNPNTITRSELDARREIPFFYQTSTVAALAPGANAQGLIQFDQDANFIWQKLTYFVDIAGGAQTDSTRVLPLVTVQLQDSGSSQGFMNAAIPIPAFIGDGRLPSMLPAPLIVKKGSTFTFNFVSYVAAGTTYNNLRLVLIGIKRGMRGA